MGPKSDDTVIVSRPRAALREVPAAASSAMPPGKPAARPVPVAMLAGMGLVVLVLAGAAAWVMRPGLPAAVPPVAAPTAAAPVVQPLPPPVTVQALPLATEAAINGGSPAVRTVLRFEANPSIVVVDFPTLAEQGRMLNRVAAWAEKGGVPHDRLLLDVELAAAIRASGATPDTYYYGHDYRGSDIVRFFALADRDRVLLLPEEEELRRIMARAQAEPAGFGALVTLVRADPAQGVTPRMRATVLHHELSHGEYFTDPAYAAFVDTVWQGVLTPGERAAFRTYLAAEGYDPALEDLMRNEMQAYLMHTADAQFFDPDKLGIPGPRLQQIRASFLAGMPPSWLKAECKRLLAELPVPGATLTPIPMAAPTHLPAPVLPAARAAAPARPRRRRQRVGLVSTVSTVCAATATVPPRRRRVSMAERRLDR